MGVLLIDVILNDEELEWAVRTGSRASVRIALLGGQNLVMNGTEWDMIQGFKAERAVAKYLGIRQRTTAEYVPGRPDVGFDIEVRATRVRNGRLQFRAGAKRDCLGRYYVLCVHDLDENARVWIKGWRQSEDILMLGQRWTDIKGMRDSEARRPFYEKTDPYFLPNDLLLPIERLIPLVAWQRLHLPYHREQQQGETV